jgi:5-methylcytosine-specific restriction endonuclease McrA
VSRGKGRKRQWSANRVTRLRKRDGDGCWLCLSPIDFSLPSADQMSRSVDHVIPRSLGGPDREWNRRLAHRKCNAEREWLSPESLLGLPVGGGEEFESWSAAH